MKRRRFVCLRELNCYLRQEMRLSLGQHMSHSAMIDKIVEMICVCSS